MLHRATIIGRRALASLAVALVACTVAACSVAPSPSSELDFVGRELTIPSETADCRQACEDLDTPFVMFDTSGAFFGRMGCQDVTGRYETRERSIRPTDVEVSDSNDCRLDSRVRVSELSRLFTSSTLFIEKADDEKFVITSAAGRLSFSVGPRLAEGAVSAGEWLLVRAVDDNGTFSGLPHNAFRLVIADDRMESFDGCLNLGSYLFDAAFDITPVPASTSEPDTCPSPYPSDARSRFIDILASAEASAQTPRFLSFTGTDGTLFLRARTISD